MKYDSDEILIKKALDTVHTPEYNIKAEVEDKIQNRRPQIYLKRKKSLILVVSLIFILSIGVAAATMPSFNNLVSLVSPDIALLLQPIGVISEDNGIKMEVVAAMNDDEMAVVYFTMQDLTGDRIDETLDIYSYFFTGARMFNIQIVDYDESTKIATLRMQANGGKKLSGKKVKFRIDSFLSHKKMFDAVDTKVDFSGIIKTIKPKVIPLDMNNIPGGGGDLYDEFKLKGIINVLKPDQMNIAIPNIDFMYISNMDYIEDYLHIQTKWVGDGIDDHGFLYFVDALGNKVNTKAASINFGVNEFGHTEYGHEYIEYIFDMRNVNLDEIRLMGDFVSDHQYTEGKWESTFKLQHIEEKQMIHSIEFDTWKASNMSISPMGITLEGRGEVNNLDGITIRANMMDGSTQIFDSVSSYEDDKDIKIKWIPTLPLDISKIESVTINDTTVQFD